MHRVQNSNCLSLQVILAKALTDKQLEKRRLEKEEESETTVKSIKSEKVEEEEGNSYKSQQEKVFNSVTLTS